jgi:peptidyl-prolyl cis-trans isomerase SurA
MNEKVWQRANTDSIGLQKFFNDHKSNYWWDQRAEVIIVEGRAEQLEKMATSSVDSLLLLEKYTVGSQADLLKCVERFTRLADTLGTPGTYVFADKNTLNKLADSFGRQDSLPIFIESSSPSDQIELLTRSKSVLEQYFNAKDALSLKVSNSVLEKDNDLIPKEYWKPGLHFVNDGVFSKVFCIGEMLEPSQKNLDEVRGKVVSDYQQYLEDEWLGALREKHKVKTSSRAWKNVVKQLDE